MCNSIIQIHFNLFFGGPYRQNLQINIIALNFNIFKYQRKNTVWSFSCALLSPVVRVPIKREFFLQLRSPFHPPPTTALTERRQGSWAVCARRLYLSHPPYSGGWDCVVWVGSLRCITHLANRTKPGTDGDIFIYFAFMLFHRETTPACRNP